MAGRLILWTTLARGRDAVTLEAVRHEGGWVTDYSVARLGLACRGHVLIRCAGIRTIRQRSMLHRLRGLEPPEVVALLKAEGFRAELMPAGLGTSHSGPAHPDVSFGTRWW